MDTRKIFLLGGVFLLTALAAPAQEPKGSAPHGADLTQEQITASVVGAMDPAVDPCADFYRYSCGGWLGSAKIPSDRSRWVRSFSVIDERNQVFVRKLLEDAGAKVKSGGATDADTARIGQYYAACMDEAAVEKAGSGPLKPWLVKVGETKTARDLLALTGELYRHGVEPLFSFGPIPDFKRPDWMIAGFSQGGIGMPDRDYYVSEDPKKKELLAAYEKHVARMLGLIGEPAEQAAKSARAIVAFETELAKASLPRAEMRDPQKRYNKLDVAGLQKLAPKLDWKVFLEAAGYPRITEANIAVPGFFEALDKTATAAPPETLQAYLRWSLVNTAADFLSKDFVNANFEFYGKTLGGQAELEPRWKRCVDMTEAALGETIGKLYVEREFAGDSKKKALEMIHDIEDAFAANLPDLAWMDDETRKRALEKRDAVGNKIGYPDKWRDYSSLKVTPNDFFANVAAASSFEFKRQLDKVGKPVDKTEWGMTPQTVNAYYTPLFNEIVFPAGILQPPFFHKDFPSALAYGGIGMVVGHELTHGFDDQGRKFDPKGKLVEWWEPEVAKKFEERAQCVVDQYEKFEVEPGVHVNGRLTLGENIADIGGLKQGYDAYEAWEKRSGGPGPSLGTLTPEQLFFVAHAQVWCSLTTPEQARLRITTDPHSPGEFRVVGPIQNHPAFAEAFKCAPGSPMNPVAKCEVW
jgi:predicted metalloendopeptidase